MPIPEATKKFLGIMVDSPQVGPERTPEIQKRIDDYARGEIVPVEPVHGEVVEHTVGSFTVVGVNVRGAKDPGPPKELVAALMGQPDFEEDDPMYIPGLTQWIAAHGETAAEPIKISKESI